MALNKTPFYRNLRTRVTFLYLEYEDLIAVLFIAPVSFFLGSFFDRELFGIPMKLVLQWGIPAVAILLGVLLLARGFQMWIKPSPAVTEESVDAKPNNPPADPYVARLEEELKKQK